MSSTRGGSSSGTSVIVPVGRSGFEQPRIRLHRTTVVGTPEQGGRGRAFGHAEQSIGLSTPLRVRARPISAAIRVFSGRCSVAVDVQNLTPSRPQTRAGSTETTARRPESTADGGLPAYFLGGSPLGDKSPDGCRAARRPAGRRVCTTAPSGSSTGALNGRSRSTPAEQQEATGRL